MSKFTKKYALNKFSLIQGTFFCSILNFSLAVQKTAERSCITILFCAENVD